jgi:hypothetical protein
MSPRTQNHPAVPAALRDELRGKQEFYRTNARYETTAQREQMARLFDRGIGALEQRLPNATDAP